MGLLESIERGFDTMDKVLGVDSRAHADRAPTAPVAPAPMPPTSAPPPKVAPSTAVRAVARIVEAIDAETGCMQYVVKLGDDEAICNSPALARDVKAMLDRRG